MRNREQWESTDPRDAGFDRTYSVVGFDDLASLRADFYAVLVALALPGGDVARAVLVDRVRTEHVRADARNLVEMLSGHDGPDGDRGQNLRNRLAMIRRDVGEVELCLGVAYGERLPTQRRQLPTPTPEMVDRTRHELAHEGGYGGRHWHLATQLEELPTAPHERCDFAIIGIDCKGRVHGSLPRPNHYQLDRWFKRDLRQLVAAVEAHPTFAETVKCAERDGLTLAFLWRGETRAAA